MNWLKPEDLGQIYGAPGPTSLRKVTNQITAEYARMIEASRFCVLATFGPRGVDASPRGDDGAVARILDPRRIALPDWHGNNRIDSLKNIVADGNASLMFMIRGSDNVLRVRGHARLTDDAGLKASFARDGKEPRTVIVLAVDEVYFQCARAIMRSGLWAGGDDSADLPTPGQILAAITDGEVGGRDYDDSWPQRAASTLW
ncbi:pyridoxamine 5'-phosphate oxidase family protein [Paracoccus sulfuroxidans]|uniref:Pyridoxamine 5'-phosphate oxidase N-terminal domain-containing protein n=1 Tax=Paracoccus sulfuroxidans TaxID=384678 RepID=A0A562NCT8_9RHOB|nr:pyridoxamine 5'-phosphate oxidase family protein [Paracoccus sulfuroxidans]TWI29910.1 hypothetical protein IQ24_03382 [Paracoccus sulfuroxidans]